MINLQPQTLNKSLPGPVQLNERKLKIIVLETGNADLLNLTTDEALELAIHHEDMSKQVGPLDMAYRHFNSLKYNYTRLAELLETRETYYHLLEGVDPAYRAIQERFDFCARRLGTSVRTFTVESARAASAAEEDPDKALQYLSLVNVIADYEVYQRKQKERPETDRRHVAGIDHSLLCMPRASADVVAVA